MPKESFARLIEIVRRLRSKEGCPWDRKQKVKDLKNYLLEEVYELLDALQSRNKELIKEELGDLFFLLVFLSYLFEETSFFTVKEVLEEIIKKMILRHPHVFSSQKVKSKEEVLNKWVKAKSKTKKRLTLWERLPQNSPSLFSTYLFLKELKALRRVSRKELEKALLEVISKVKHSQKKDLLIDLIFYSALFLSYSQQNPELLLKKRLKQESLKLFYEG